MHRHLIRILTPLLAAILVAPHARATWSILVVDHRTREVCIGSATCLPNFNLQRALPVVVPGVGVAAAQSVVDVNGTNRRRIWDGFLADETPAEILAALGVQDGQHQSRQYGIVMLDREPVTFSGVAVGIAKLGVTGTVGDVSYAIQGNLLTGSAVVNAARNALLQTEGHISKRVMAAMEAAASRGGDGRCSCNPLFPTSCGVPPGTFQYSAYTAFLIAARVGDATSGCGLPLGCGEGSYFLDLNVVSFNGGAEPVEELRRRYDEWRLTTQYRVDGTRSFYEPSATSVVADGRSSALVKFRLRNLDGDAFYPTITTGVDVFRIDGPEIATIGTVGGHGINRFGFKLTATDVPGTATFRMVIRQGPYSVRLEPDFVLRSDPVERLHVGRDEWDASGGGRIPFTLNVPEAAGRPYLLFGSSSGTAPGTPFGEVTLPLNRDRVLLATLEHSGSGRLPSGVLDASGHGETSLVLMPGLLSRWSGRRLDWAAVILGEPRTTTNPAGFVVY